MLLTKKQKRTLTISLVITFVALIVVGMAVGLYFLLSSNGSGLSAEQLGFGKAINSSTPEVKREQVDLSKLPSDIAYDEIVLLSDSYVVVKSSTDVYHIYSLENKEPVQIENDFLSIEKIIGNVAIIQTSHGRCLFDLTNGHLISNLQNATISCGERFVLVQSSNFEEVGVIGFADVESLAAYVLDTETNQLVFTTSLNGYCIKLEMFEHNFVATFADRTEIYSLDEGFKLLRKFDNVSKNAAANVESLVTGKGYAFESLYRVFEVEKDVLLIEGVEFGIEGADIVHNGEGYKLSYSLLCSGNTMFELDNKNSLIRPVDIDIDGYIALTFTAIKNKAVTGNKTISYLKVGNKGIDEVVSYDYSSGGKIVGFDGKNLITNYVSSVDFNGKFKSNFGDNGQVFKGIYDDSLVVSSVIGLKQLYSKDGKLLSDASYVRLSPFNRGKALAFDGVEYYILSSSGEAEAIDLCQDYADFLFMGLDMYVVKTKTGFSVYNLDKQLLYSGDKISFCLTDEKTVLMSIEGEQKQLVKIDAQTGFVPTSQGSSVSQFANKSRGFSQKRSVAYALEGDEELAAPELVLDATSGVGKATFSVFTRLTDLHYRGLEELSEEELALIPEFDYDNIYLVEETQQEYSVSGIYFMTQTNVLVVIIRLEKSDGETNYLVNVALKDVYLSKVTSDQEVFSFIDGKQSLPLDYSQNVLAAADLTGKTGLFDEEEAKDTRRVNYQLAGYEGGFVLALGQTDDLSLNIELRNTFVSSARSSQYIPLSGGDTTIEAEKFSISISTNENGVRVATISADSGYLINGFELVYARAGILYESDSYEEVFKQSYDLIVNSYSFELSREEAEFFKIDDVSIIEKYCVLRLQDYDDSKVEDVYHFDKAPLGFENFYKKENVKVLTRKGYEFTGYALNDIRIIDGEGRWIDGNSALSSTSWQIEYFVANATYNPKTYIIFYEDGNQPIPDHQTEVKFDQIVGEMYTITKEGYDFKGWFTMANGEFVDEIIPFQTKYTYDEDITVHPKWEAKTYTLTVLSNVENYNNVTLGGFEYNLDRVVDETNNVFTSWTKEITFGRPYGQLPVLRGFNSNSQATADGFKEIYTFIGYFTSPSFTIGADGTMVNDGQEITASDIVGADEEPKLYAHFIREIYDVTSSISVDGEAFDGEDTIPAYESFVYVGSNENGLYGEYDAEDVTAHTLQNGQLTFKLKLNEGYYVSQISITIGEQIYTITGIWNKENDRVTLQNAENDAFIVSIDAENTINVAFLSVYGSKNYANVEFNLVSKSYSNKITIVDETDNTTIVESNTEGNEHVFDGANYGSTQTYTFKVNGSDGIDNSYLSRITIGETIFDFDVKYEITENEYLLNVTCPSEHSSVWDGNIRTDIYLTNFNSSTIRIILTYNKESRSYVYSIQIVQYCDCELSAEFELLSGAANVNLTADGETDPSGAFVNTTYNGESVQNATQQIIPSDTLIYDIVAKDGYLISKLSMTINSQRYQIATMNIEMGRADIVRYCNYVATADMFIANGNLLTMKGTGITIEYVEAQNSFKITIKNISTDVSFDVSYVGYSIITIASEEEILQDYYDCIITDGELSLVSKTLAELKTDCEEVLQSYHSDTIYCYNNTLLIIGYKDSIKAIKFMAKQPSTFALRVESVTTKPTGQATINKNLDEVTFNTDIVGVLINLEHYDSSFAVESYLGIGGEDYTLEPYDEFEQTKINVAYYNQEKSLVSEDVDLELGGKIVFNSDEIVFKVYKRTGYTFEKLVFSDDDVVFEPSISEQVDDNGDYVQCVVKITNFVTHSYKAQIYMKAAEYDIEYLAEGAEGSTENSHHVYNVRSNLSDNGFVKEGYVFVGWSKIEKSGIELTEDDIDFEGGALLGENLAENDGDVVNLYAVFKVVEYSIKYENNDVNSGNGSSIADRQGGSTSVRFEHDFGELATIKREGYNFLGWFTSHGDEGTKLSDNALLNAELLALLEVEEKSITLYAKWDAVHYTINIKKNDASEEEGFGSSFVNEEVSPFVIVYDTPFERLSPLSRVGYNFLGYKTSRLDPETALNNNDAFFGYGENCITELNSETARALGLTLTASPIFDIYAVFTPILYSGYVNLNNETLGTYGKEDGMFTVRMNGYSDVKSSSAYVNVYISVLFDHAFGEMPIVIPVGYNFEGLFAEKGNALEIPETNELLQDSVLDITLYNLLSYSSSTGQTSSLKDLGNSNSFFSMYAHYSSKEYSVTYDSASASNPRSNVYNLKGIDDYNNYDYTTATGSGDPNRVVTEYYGDAVLDLLTVKGIYIQTIQITDSNREPLLNVIFKWDSSGVVTMSINNADYGDSTNSSFVRVMDNIAYIGEGIYIKLLPYNTNGEVDPSNAVVDAVRVIIGFDGIKTDFNVSVRTSNQMFKIDYYRYFTGYSGFNVTLPETYVKTIEVEYNRRVGENLLDYSYVPQFSFVSYYYGKLDGSGEPLDPRTDTGNLVQLGETLKGNYVFVGLYTLVQKQAVNFYMFDSLTGQYKLREETNNAYVLYYYDAESGQFVAGAYDGINYSTKGVDGGKLLRLPSPSSETWPEGTSFSGYLLATRGPVAGGYYSFAMDNFTEGSKILDLNTLIETEVNAYAIYDVPKFNLQMRLNNGNVEATSDIDIYELDSEGVVSKVAKTDVYYAMLSEQEIQLFKQYIADPTQTVEVALRRVLGDVMGAAYKFNTDNYEQVVASSPTTYYFAFTIKQNSNGEYYIYDVASNYYRYDGNNLSSYNIFNP